ncbi:MAG: hypothetical protein Q9201_005415 [Fulgogasparrea decipioides]
MGLDGLLALKVHADSPHYLACPLPSDIQTRIFNAASVLEKMLCYRDAGATVHVGFEILFPALLRFLNQKGFPFKFPGLMALNRKRLARFDPRILHGQTRLTLVHSLEALVRIIDFDRVGQHKVCGSMMGSSASTAAYMMHSSTCDMEAEEYLATVVRSTLDGDFGGVPSAYATPTFKVAWNLASLYSEMLLSHAFVRLLQVWDKGRLSDTLEDLIKAEEPLISCQLTIRVLQRLASLPSAGEAISYGFLALTKLASLPWLHLLDSRIAGTIEKGRRFLSKSLESNAEAGYLWVEKVTFSSPILSKTYRLAALKAAPSTHVRGTEV